MISQKKPEWQAEHTIRSYDVDPQTHVKVASLCRFMQEAAYQHAEHLDLGRAFMLPQKQAWVLARQRIEMESLPKWNDTVHVRTWPSGRDRLFFYRDFEIMDGGGNLVLRSSTAWFIIDLEKRERIQPAWLETANYPIGPKVFDAKLGRLKGCNCPGGTPVPVSYGDLDMNGHVNNIRYIEWVLNHLPLTFHQEHQLKLLEVNYLSEAVYGHSVSVWGEKVDPLTFLHGVISEDGELFRARSVWK